VAAGECQEDAGLTSQSGEWRMVIILATAASSGLVISSPTFDRTRWPVRGIKTRQNITWLNFHQWCKRISQQSGREEDYKALWAQHFETEQEL
jgi:hypothetical protein